MFRPYGLNGKVFILKNRAKTGMLWGILSGPHIPGCQRVAYIGFATGGKMAVKPEFVRKKIVYLPPILT